MTSGSPDNFQFGFVSPPPNYQHTHSSSFSSFQFILSSQPSSRQNTYEHEDEHYLVKYKDMKQKVKELELDNDRLHVKCLSIRKNIQRLRLERAILYERLQAINPDLNSNPISQNVTPHVPTTRHSDPAPTQEQPQLSQSNYINHSLNLPPPIPSSVSPLETLAHTLCERPVLKQNVITTNPINAKGSAGSFPEIRNGNYIKTFPFVHEYSTTQLRGRQQAQRRRRQQQEAISSIPSEYPIEIKFHQYEGGSLERQSGQRGKRGMDYFDEKGGKQRRRLQQAELDKAEPNARKLHVATFRDQFIYSFQVHPMPQGDLAQPRYGFRDSINDKMCSDLN
ncbi:hypothetical protein Clacol_001444 [Clathrus columnatus]|uniref:INO80 complex subunit F domain-containing protein n=1 Tax=Clathrus columnatus TaxID=1419009 RepID=A0AAV4ZYA2_9AGAM|nr:hypothetical protein Clacol_001444 [Clathrus columnatus]